MITLAKCNESDTVLDNSIRMLKLMVPKIVVKDKFVMMDSSVKKYLIVGEKGYYIINLLDNCFSSVDIFNVDDNGIINYLRFHGSDLILDNGVAYSYNNKVLETNEEDIDEDDYYKNYMGCVKSSLALSSIPVVETSFSSYNALINYLSYDFNGEKSLFCRYLYNARFDGTDRISESYCKMPFHINVVSLKTDDINKDDKEYFLTQWNRNDRFYGLALTKIVPFMSYLEGEIKDDFEFYYDRPIFDEQGKFNIWNHLRSHVYDEEDMKRLLSKNGLDWQIPSELIDLYNGDTENYMYAKNVISAMEDFGCLKKRLNK